MTVEEEPGGRIVLTYDSVRFARLLFVLAAVFLAVAVYDVVTGRDDRMIGLLGGGATLAGMGVVMLEQARAVVDPVAKRIEWSRRWAFRRHSGSMAFADIRAVSTERPIGDEGVPSRRIVIRTRQGDLVPLTTGYRPDGDEVLLRAAIRIEAIIGLDDSSTPERAAHLLVEAGRVVDAIKVLREGTDVSLEEAKRRVDDMKTRKA